MFKVKIDETSQKIQYNKYIGYNINHIGNLNLFIRRLQASANGAIISYASASGVSSAAKNALPLTALFLSCSSVLSAQINIQATFPAYVIWWSAPLQSKRGHLPIFCAIAKASEAKTTSSSPKIGTGRIETVLSVSPAKKVGLYCI